MYAFQVTEANRPPSLTKTPIPIPAKGEVLLRIHACGLNFADLLMVKGTYQDTPAPPFTLGLEVCGTVVAHGEGVSHPIIGARVAVFGGQGGLAEFGTFPAADCIAVPGQMTSVEAAGFQVAYGTSHLALTRRARLKAKERLVVTGAAGGVGLTAVELGKALGAEVVAIARGEAKLRIAKEAGADHAIDSTRPLEEIVQELKTMGGVDVVYDAVGGDLFDALFRACNREARILVIGFASGDVPRIPANHLLVKNIDVMGFYWGGYLAFNPQALRQSMSELFSLFQVGKLIPHVSHVLPLDRAQDALDLLTNRKSTGKVVVTPQELSNDPKSG